MIEVKQSIPVKGTGCQALNPLNFQRLTCVHVSEPTTSPQEETAAGGTLAKEAEKVHQKALWK
jgi:hypothetical protein